ncbi:hypothetical protein Q8W71_27870 [Methylobacterium sp. NEAU 140]|uniref:hypothetical protein n=1 Tax=Methylobacterium sp. NEAU 140 TaxID=3064945 RepID=UPI0027336271|nr:hypothetical protein [Methylobacterium sp. NEAU 140]MDP4026443.1 hypothetical protein [Methylobacterium sp. NEAU 140]
MGFLLVLGIEASPVSAQDASATGNADLLKATVELVYQCKLVADESFIRQTAIPRSDAGNPIDGCGGTTPFFQAAAAPNDIDCDGVAARLTDLPDKRVPANLAQAFERRCRRVRLVASRRDEGFRRTVFALYANAYVTLLEAGDQDPEGPARQRIALLAKDIEFRTELLSIGEDFWGGTITGVPSIPPIHLAAMSSLLSQLESLAKEIRDIEARLEDKSIKTLELSAQAAGAEGEVRASLPSSDKLDLLKRQAEQRVATATAQVTLLQARQKQIEGEQAKLSAQIDALSASINKALVSAIGNYLGVPPELQKVAEGGSVEEAFKSYVGAKAGELLADPDLISSFGAIGESAAIYVQRVQEAKREVEGYVKKAGEIREIVVTAPEYVDAFKAVLRQPTVENLTRIGTKVLDKVAPAQAAELRRGFCRVVEQQKPIAALLEQAREPGILSDKIRGGILEGLRKLPDYDARLPGYLKSVVAEVSPLRQVAWLKDLLRRGGEIPLPPDASDRLRTELVRVVATLWPRSLIARMPSQHRQELLAELRRRFGIGSQEELVDRIEEIGAPRLVVRTDRIVITVGDSVFPVAEWSEFNQALDQLTRFEVEAAKVQDRIQSAVDRLARTGALQDTIAREIFGQIPFGTLEREVENLRGQAANAKKVWDGALATVGEKLGAPCEAGARKGTVVGNLVEMQAGARMALEIGTAREAAVRFDKAPDPGAAPLSPPAGDGIDGARGEEGAMEREIALRALDAAFPPAGAVTGLAIKVFQGMQETRELGRKMRELTEESVRLTRTEIQLLATIDATRVAVEVNRLDGELSEIKRAAAVAQYDTLTRAGQKAGAQTLVGLAQIQRRQPLVFYLAERLRQEYDLLDRSISLWGPQGGTTRDAIRRLVEEDPQNVRLALDTDIHLFQWLDRSEDRVRTDIDRVVTHWRQLHRLVSDVCDRIGCTPGQSRLGQVQQTAMIDVCTLMAQSDCRRFRDWLARDPRIEQRGADTFSAEIGLNPDEGHIPAHLLNVRVVDVRLGAFARPTANGNGAREPLRLNAIQLLHPGVAFVHQPAGFVREAMAPSETTSFDWPGIFDLEALGSRWNAGARPSRRHFEGYGLVTAWRLVATRSPTTARIDRDADGPEADPPARDLRSGVFVRFAYAYHLPPPGSGPVPAFAGQDGNPQIENQLKRPVVQVAGRARADLRTIEIPQGILRLIGDAPAYAAAQATWLDPGRREDAPASLDCKAEPPTEAAAGFASRVCLASLDAHATEALVREQATALMRSCLGAATLVSRTTATARRREVEHLVASRYGPAYEAAKTLARNTLGPGQGVDVRVGEKTIRSTYEFCPALCGKARDGCRP